MTHFIASGKEAAVQTWRAENMVSGILGINYKISKANRTDGKVQNLAAHIDKDMLKAIHRKMKSGKASGIDKVTKEEYEAEL
ncbi:MAG: hypothetical protein ACI4XF_05415, partial [Oscillospiraceae bacterium]